ncbi:MAG: CPBP family intramembrane metalloprotease [Chloroflexi bacterium]|nr:CPBP family intramembrane metalloprotease [Chloroflexota bacterium]
MEPDRDLPKVQDLQAVGSPAPDIRFNWRLFWLLCGLYAIGALVMLPLSFTLALSDPSLQGVEVSPYQLAVGVAIAQFIVIVIYGVLIAIGLLCADRVGLGAPILAGLLAREPVRERLKKALGVSLVAGVILPTVELVIIVTTRLMQGKPVEFGFFFPPDMFAPAWQLGLSAIGAGITEETFYRLFLLSLFAWMGGLVVRSRQGRSWTGVLWVATILAAFGFGLCHLSTATLDDPFSLTRSIALNSLGGLVFGWLYWAYGLESAMAGHFLADVVIYVIAPVFISL